MGLVCRLLSIAMLVLLAAGSTSHAQTPCELAAKNGIGDCRSENLKLRAGDWRGHAQIVSDVINLDKSRLYWACCATDAAGNASADLQRSIFLVILPDKRYSAETTLEECAASVDPSVEQQATAQGSEAIWGAGRAAEAMIVGWVDFVQVDRSALCRSAPPNVDATAPGVGNVLVVSIPAKSLGDGE